MLQRSEPALPRQLRTRSRTVWAVQQVALFAAAIAMLPLVSRIALVIPWLHGAVWMLAWIVVPLVRGGDMAEAQPKLAVALARASDFMAPQFASMLGAVEIELGRVERGLAILESADLYSRSHASNDDVLRLVSLGRLVLG